MFANTGLPVSSYYFISNIKELHKLDLLTLMEWRSSALGTHAKTKNNEHSHKHAIKLIKRITKLGRQHNLKQNVCERYFTKVRKW